MMLENVFSLWGMIIVAIVCSSLVSLATIFAKQWRKARTAEMEATLKAEMIKQGRSAEEIEKVLKATGNPSAHANEDA
jgi:hypothetical protein